jgi:ATP phosphoribosyltransferase regulatory subunit
MTADTTNRLAALEAQSARIMAAFADAGYERVAPSIIQPADVFLDVVGEALRARTYVFADQEGAELCLRPELTVPACRIYLDRHPTADVPARYCYLGLVFRFQPGGGSAAHPRELTQAGIESFAAGDPLAADVEVLLLTLKAVRAAGVSRIQLRIGDVGLFDALLGAIDMPNRWRSRLRHLFWRSEAFRAELRRLASSPADAVRGLPAELIASLDSDAAAAEEQLLRYLDAEGLDLIGTRTAGEIVEILRQAAADTRASPLAPATVDLIEDYLSISGPVHAAAARVRELTRAHGVDIGGAIDAFERRLARIAAGGIAIEEADFSAEFGRNFEYYTGFVFEALSPQLGPKSPLAGGGRYDSMLKTVGAKADVPAVGAAIYTERVRLAAAGDGA